jgi:proteic killer suppression protein
VSDPLVPGQGHRGDLAAPLHQETKSGLSRLTYNKLVLINAAENINDLRVPPGNRLEKLAGGRAGQYSVRVNDQWRICFTWSTTGAGNVELVDYH